MALEYPYRDLVVGPPLDKDGGQGIVYAVDNARINATLEVVYKEYHRTEQPPNWQVLRQLVDVRENLAPSKRKTLVSRTAWPLAIVTRHGGPVGVLMRKAPDDFWFTLRSSRGSKRKLAQVKHLLNSDEAVRRKGVPPPSNEARYRLVRDVATTLALLHDAQVGAGDISAGNLLFSFNGIPRAFYIDCDSMSLRGRTALEQKETVNWKVQDVHPSEQLATADSDIYKLGLFGLRIFARRQNALGPDVDALSRTVHPRVCDLIRESTSQPAGKRPTAEDWVSGLAALTGPAPTQALSRGRTRQSNVSRSRPSGKARADLARVPSRGTTAEVGERIRQRQRRLAVGLGAAVAAVVVLGVLWSLMAQRTETAAVAGAQSAVELEQEQASGQPSELPAGPTEDLSEPASEGGPSDPSTSLSVDSIVAAVNHRRASGGLDPVTAEAAVHRAAVALAEEYQRDEGDRRDSREVLADHLDGWSSARYAWWTVDPTIDFDPQLILDSGDSTAHLGDFDRLGVGTVATTSGDGLAVILLFIRDH